MVSKEILKFFKTIKNTSLDELWLRDVSEQIKTTFEFKREAIKIIEEDLRRDYAGKNMVIEGAVLLPEYIAKNNIDYNKIFALSQQKIFKFLNIEKEIG